jgi:hypothetical protein
MVELPDEMVYLAHGVVGGAAVLSDLSEERGHSPRDPPEGPLEHRAGHRRAAGSTRTPTTP